MDPGTVESDAFILTVPGSTPVPRPAIESTALFISAQFQYPLTDRLRATWHVGIADAEFEADGSIALGFAVIGPLSPFRPFPQPELVDVPFGDPDDELGYFFGFGMSWRFNPHLDIEVRYSRLDLEVLEFDTFGIRLIGRL